MRQGSLGDEKIISCGSKTNGTDGSGEDTSECSSLLLFLFISHSQVMAHKSEAAGAQGRLEAEANVSACRPSQTLFPLFRTKNEKVRCFFLLKFSDFTSVVAERKRDYCRGKQSEDEGQ